MFTLARRVPAGVGLLFAFFVPVLLDVSATSALRYALWSLAWLVCGAGVVAAMSGARGFTRWTLGAVVGILLQLVNWAVWQGLSLPGATIIGAPLAVLVGAALLRCEHQAAPKASDEVADVSPGTLRGSTPDPSTVPSTRTATAAGATRASWDDAIGATAGAFGAVPVSSLWAWVAATVWAGASFLGDASRQTLPPGTSTMSQDLYWHLGLVGEFKHALIPQVPQAASGQLNYHWLSDAYMASGSLGAFTSSIDVALRLWMIPIVALTFALTLVVTARLSRSWVAGNVAMLTLAAPAAVSFMGWLGAGPHTPFVWLSPSQVFGLPFTLWALYLFTPVLRGARVRPATGALLLVTVFACAGAKSSILPVFGAGSAVVLVAFLRRREVRRGALVVGAICAAGIVMALPLFAGGSAGSQLRLLSSARRSGAYSEYLHLPRPTGHGPMIPSHIATPAVFAIIVGVLAVMILGYAYAATSVMLGAAWRRDPMPLFLLGSFVGSLAAFQLIDHTGMSQGYFPLGALPLLAVLTGWGFAVAWENAPRERRRPVALLAALVGGGVVAVSRWLTGPRVPSHSAIPAGVLVPSLVMAAVVAVLLILMRRRALVAASVLLGLGVVQAAVATATTTVSQFDKPAVATASHSVLPSESAAAFWLRDHSEPHDLVATNVHCRGVVSTANCDRRAFWVSGFSERRMLVESWGYMDAPQKAAGKRNLPAVRQPYPDQALYMQNESVFHAPNATNIAAIKKRGVKWLFGDSRASKVSPDLAKHAELVHTSGPVTIYRIR